MDKKRGSKGQNASSKYRESLEVEEQEPEPQRECHLCGSIPDSIICLNCGHDLDIPCAVRILLESQDSAQPDLAQIKCSVCGEETMLSEEVQEAIINFNQNQNGEEEEGEEEEENEEGGKEEEYNEAEEDHEAYKPQTLELRFSSKKAHRVTPSSRQKDSVSEANVQDVSLHFACMDHPTEEYSYYSASNKRLYCAQCLLEVGVVERTRDMKSLRKSVP